MIEPRYSFEYIPQPRRVDKSLPLKEKIPKKLEAIALDFKDYVSDIINNRQDRYCFKTADFIKRNACAFNHKVIHRITHTLHHIWEELVKVGQGFRLLNEDFKFYVKS